MSGCGHPNCGNEDHNCRPFLPCNNPGCACHLLSQPTQETYTREQLRGKFFAALDAYVRERQTKFENEGQPTIYLSDVHAAIDDLLDAIDKGKGGEGNAN